MKKQTNKTKKAKIGVKHIVALLLVAILTSYCRQDQTSGQASSSSSSNPVVWYVDPAAPDGGDGLSPATAFNSITRAILPYNRGWDAGDDIVLLPGNYNKEEILDFSTLPIASGYPQNYLTITAQQGAVIHQPLIIKGAKYLVLQSLYFEDVNGEALVIENSEAVSVKDCNIIRTHNINNNPDPTQDIPGNSIHFKGVSGGRIENCSLTNAESEGIFVESSTAVYMENDYVNGASDTALLIADSNDVEVYYSAFFSSWIGLQVRGYSEGIYIHYCVMLDNLFAGFATTLPGDFNPSNPVKVERILSARNNVGIYLSGDKGTSLTNVTVAHNTNTGVVISRTAGVSLTNSIVAFNDTGIADYSNTSIDTFIDYIDAYSNPSGNFLNVLPYNNVIYADPLFVDPANNDYSLMEISPCIDAGDPDVTPPEGGEPVVDLGALEYIKSSSGGPIY